MSQSFTTLLRELAATIILASLILAITTASMIWAWGGDLPSSISWSAYFFNIIFLAAPISILRIFLNVPFTWAISLSAALLLAYFNHLKITYLNMPLQLDDLFILQISPITLRYIGTNEMLAVLGFLLVLLFTAVYRIFKKQRAGNLSALKRASIAAGFSVCFLMLFVGPGKSWLLQTYTDLGHVQTNAVRDGYFLTSFTRAHTFRANVPRSPGAKEILRDFRFPLFAPLKRPRDIVLIQLESFDDLKSSGLNLKPGFIPHYQRLKARSQNFRAYSPVFGGVTANAEFEALTGMTSKADPLVSVPYTAAMNHKIPSIAWQLKAHGYTSFAFHNSEKTSWNREAALHHLGFDHFLSDEDLYKGGAPLHLNNDNLIFSSSLERLKEIKRPAMFHFLITVETHGPYGNPWPVPVPRTNWLLDKKDTDFTKQVNDYAERMQKLDTRLGTYIAELEKLPRKPIVILFADHQPHFLLKLHPGKFNQALYEVDLIVRDVGSTSQARSVRSSHKNDLFCVAPLVLHLATVPLAPYFQYLNEFCRKYGSISRLNPSSPPDAKVKFELDALTVNRLWGVENDDP